VRDTPRDGRGGGSKWIATALAVFGICLGFVQPWRYASAQSLIMAEASADQPEVVLYATSWCPYCAKTREFFRMHGIRYTEYDIEHNAVGAEGYRRLGGNGVPIIVIGADVVHGYDPDRMTELLRQWLRNHPRSPASTPEQATIDAPGTQRGEPDHSTASLSLISPRRERERVLSVLLVVASRGG
jgi:glutaredoxin